MHGAIDFKAIAAAALACSRSLLLELVPGGIFDGDEYIALNPSRADKTLKSFKINSKDGQWSDFATGAKGGDVTSWFAHARGLSQGEAARQIAEKLGVSTLKINGDNTKPPPKIYAYGEEGPPVEHNEQRRHYYPKNGTPKKKVKIKKRDVPKHRQWTNCYRVFRDGEPIGWQWQKPADYRSVAYADVGTDTQRLFGPEGEKDADTLSKLGLTAFTYGGGDGLPNDVDEYLKRIFKGDRRLIIPIDNDDGGRKQGQKRANKAHACGIKHIYVFDPATVWPECPEGGDISDWFEKGGGTRERLIEIVDALPDWQPSASDNVATESDTSTKDDDAGASWEFVDTLQAKKWPEIDEAAYYGLAGEVVKTIEPHTESDPVGILLGFIASFGNVVGNNPYYQVESDHHHTNLNVVYVGASAKGRKGTADGRVKAVIKSADETWFSERMASGLSSGEGLINAVRDEVPKWDAEAHQFKIIDPGVADKRLMVTEPEFAGALSAMERHGNTLSPIIRNAWDGKKLQTMTKGSPQKATGAHISIIAHITEDEARARLTKTEMANGFANRFLFCCVKRSKLLPHGGALTEADLANLSQRVKNAVGFARQVGRVKMTKEAAQAWEAAYPELSAEGSGLTGAVIARSEAQAVRLALIYALLDRQDAISPQHLEAAMALWAYCEESALRIFGDSLGDPIADDILRALRQSGADGMTRTAISSLFARNRSSAQIDAALALLARGHARMESKTTNGRPIEIWFAAGGRR